ncbi:deoxyribose-phosphate aldolase [Bacteroidia bacterium]|nr:deoxyribose-phosphate aldolase [Bacteroidia bacterium]
MNHKSMLNLVDHTALGAVTEWSDIEKLCSEAIQYNTASVCIPPSYVKKVSEKYGNKLAVCTVIGFPLGYSTKETKIFEAVEAVKNGATEIDMVVNLGDVKNKDFCLITDEIKSIKEAVGSNILKVIVETCYLSKEEKIRLCECVTEAGADFIKTSTGFGTAGAQLADIELFKKHTGKNVRIKAAGGIRTKEQFEAFAAAGVHRIGASAAVKLYNHA